MKTITKREVLTGLLVVLVALVIQSAVWPLVTRVTLPTPGSPHAIVSSDLGWSEKWRLVMPLGGFGNPMAISDEKLIVAVQDMSGLRLSALDSNNGRLIWSSDLISPYDANNQRVDSLLADSEQVYAAVPFVIKSFQLSDGKPLWTTEDLGGHRSYHIQNSPNPDEIQVVTTHGLAGGMIYNMRKATGQTTGVQISDIRTPILTSDWLVCYKGFQLSLTCSDARTNQDLWTIQPMSGQIELLDSNLLVYSDGPYLKSIVGANPKTGKTQWRTNENNFASNFVVISNTVYAVSEDAALIGYNVMTGREVGRIVLGKVPLDVNHSSKYWLLTDGSRLWVYLGDSQELIAFEQK